MTYFVYILYSKKLNRFYTGFTTQLPEERLAEHNTGYYQNSFSKSGIPWTLFFTISCSSESQARAIEKHIKRMKRVRYIKNLMEHPEIGTRLKNKYS